MKNELELDVVDGVDAVFMITRAPTRLVRGSRSFRDGAVPTQELRITDQKDAKTDAHQLVCGDGDSSVLQPAWHASGALFYLTDERGFLCSSKI